MRDTDLFRQVLGLSAPWFAERCTFDPDQKQLDLYIDFAPGGRFTCPDCGRPECTGYDPLAS